MFGCFSHNIDRTAGFTKRIQKTGWSFDDFNVFDQRFIVYCSTVVKTSGHPIQGRISHKTPHLHYSRIIEWCTVVTKVNTTYISCDILQFERPLTL
ncbi:hypothetical protein D3C81_939380 [compost metagenome]